MMAGRREGDAGPLADVLSAASPGVSGPVWVNLASIEADVLLIAGTP